MKKVIISILSLAMTVSMAVPAFADTTADVQGKYKAGAESPVTISADITWEDMTFDYTEGEKTWNTETHQVDQADGKWTSDTKAITVTNHSNVGIMAKFNFAPEGDIEGSFTKDGTSTDKLELDTIKNLDEGSAAPSDTMNFGITGGAISENCKLGTITVYITSNDNSSYIFTEAELNEDTVKKTHNEKKTAFYPGKMVESSLFLWYNTMHCFVCFKFYYTGLTLFFANKFTLLYMLFTRIGKKIRQPLPTT